MIYKYLKVNLLIDESNNINSYSTRKQDEVEKVKDTDASLINRYGPIWTFFKQTYFYGCYRIRNIHLIFKYEQLKYYDCLIYQKQANEQTGLLLQVQ